MIFKKKIELFKGLNYVNTGKTLHKIKITASNAAFYGHQPLCLVDCTLKCGLESERVNRAYPFSFICSRINRFSSFWALMFIQLFWFFLLQIAKNLALFCPSCKLFTLNFSRKNVVKLTIYSKSSLFYTNSCKVLVRGSACFVGFYFFEDKMIITEHSQY